MQTKLTITVMLEGGRSFTEEYNSNQKLIVLINRTRAEFNLKDSDLRILYRMDDPITDYQLTLSELGIRNGETLKYLLSKAPVPDKPKKFA